MFLPPTFILIEVICMNTRKKMNLFFLWHVFLISLASLTPVYASVVEDVVGDLSNFVSTEALNGLIGWISELYNALVGFFVFSLVELFGPDTTLYDNILGVTAYKDFPYIGTVMMIIIYVVMMIFCAFGAIRLSETKDTPLSLTGRLIIGFILMFFSNDIVQLFFTEGSLIYNKIWNSTSDDINAIVSELSFPVSRTIYLVANSTTSTYVVTDTVVALILAYILGIIFVVQVTKFFLEIIERYIVSCFLYYIFPLPLSTIVAKNASAIFKKYMQMFIIQIIMLLMNVFFMRIIVNMPLKLADTVFNDGTSGTFMFYLFLFGFMKVARKIDSYAYTMGLSVAITGNSVLDACKGTGMAMLGMARGLTSGARTVGNATTSLGAAMGNAGIMNAGMKLSGLANAGMGRGVDTSMSGALKEASMRGVTEEIAKSIRPEQVDQSMVNAARFGDIRANNGLNSLNDDTKAALVGKAFGPGVCPDGSTMSNIHFDFHGGFSADFTDANGVTTPMSISPTANYRTVGSFTDQDGNGYYFNPLKPSSTSAASYTFDSKNPGSLHQAESHFGQSFAPLGKLRDSVNAVRKAENGDLLFYGPNRTNGENSVLARMDANGKVSRNDKPFTLSPKTLGNLSTFSNYSDLRMKDNENGSVSVYGKNTKKSGSPVENATLYNKANYSKEEAQQANGGGTVTSISGGSSSGNWWCVKSSPAKSPEAVADLQNAHEKLPSLISYDADGNFSGYSSIEVQPFYGGTADSINSINVNNINNTNTSNSYERNDTSYSSVEDSDFSTFDENEDYEMGSDVDNQDMNSFEDYSEYDFVDVTMQADDYYDIDS